MKDLTIAFDPTDSARLAAAASTPPPYPGRNPLAVGACAVALAAGLAWSGTVYAFDELAALDDEFDNPVSLGAWRRIHQVEGWHADQLEAWAIDPGAGGRMTVMPFASTWYQDWRGALAYKEVAGDFVVTTDVAVANRAGTGAPDADFSLAGVMIRTPRSAVVSPATWAPDGENYVFLSLGSATTPGTYQYEDKTTVDSVSTLFATPGVPRAQIRMARIGDAVIALRRPEGGAWQVHRRFDRPDMPDTLQVGLTAYTDWPTASSLTPFEHNQTVLSGGSPDLVAQFDFVRYRRPRVPPALVGLDLTDPVQVDDAALLGFLGEVADAFSASLLQIQASYAAGSLHLDFNLRPAQDVTWAVGLVVGSQFLQLLQRPLSALSAPFSPSFSMPGFPALGALGVWSTFTTVDGDVIGADIVPVDAR